MIYKANGETKGGSRGGGGMGSGPFLFGRRRDKGGGSYFKYRSVFALIGLAIKP